MATPLEDYIRRAAASRGIDPDIAVRVAKSEGGLNDPTRQSLVRKNGVQEPSYGPFQLLVGGGNTGFPEGMGNDFVARTGMHPSDPNAAYKGIDFALDNAKSRGWGAWYGAKAAGIGNFDGINGRATAAVPDGPKGQETYIANPRAEPTAPVIGSMAPNVPAFVEMAAGGGREPQDDSPSSYLSKIFGAMGSQQQTQDAPPPPANFQQNPQQANALLSLVQALKGRVI